MKQVIRSVKQAELLEPPRVTLLSVRKHESRVAYLKSDADHGYLDGTQYDGIPVWSPRGRELGCRRLIVPRPGHVPGTGTPCATDSGVG